MLELTQPIAGAVKFATGFVNIDMFPKVNGVVPHAFVTSKLTSKLVAGQLLVV